VETLHSTEAWIFRGAGDLRCATLAAMAVAASALLPVCARASGPAHNVAPVESSSAAADYTPPARIVSLVPAITETLFALDLADRVVGVSTYCDDLPPAAALAKVGTFTEPVAEAIVSLHPDLVLTSPSPGNETAVRAIERTGVKVAVVQSEGGLREARSAMLEVAALVGAVEAGKRLVARIDSHLAAIQSAAATLDRPVAAIVVGREPLVLAGPGSYLGELLVLAGGTNVADAIGGRWPRVGMEFLVASAPEVIFDLSVSMGETLRGTDAAQAWSSLPSLPAVASGRVIADNASMLLRPGPRLAEAADVLFAGLHPQAQPPARAQARPLAHPEAPALLREDTR